MCDIALHIREEVVLQLGVVAHHGGGENERKMRREQLDESGRVFRVFVITVPVISQHHNNHVWPRG